MARGYLLFLQVLVHTLAKEVLAHYMIEPKPSKHAVNRAVRMHNAHFFSVAEKMKSRISATVVDRSLKLGKIGTKL